MTSAKYWNQFTDTQLLYLLRCRAENGRRGSSGLLTLHDFFFCCSQCSLVASVVFDVKIQKKWKNNSLCTKTDSSVNGRSDPRVVCSHVIRSRNIIFCSAVQKNSTRARLALLLTLYYAIVKLPYDYNITTLCSCVEPPQSLYATLDKVQAFAAGPTASKPSPLPPLELHPSLKFAKHFLSCSLIHSLPKKRRNLRWLATIGDLRLCESPHILYIYPVFSVSVPV